MNKPSSNSKLLPLGILLVQLIDVVIHLSIEQLEPIRVISNVVIVAWIVAASMGQLKERLRSSSLAAMGVYILLNLIFLAQNGLTNPGQDGAPRSMLFVLVIATVVLSALFISRISTPDPGD